MAFVNPAPPSSSGLWIHTICWDSIAGHYPFSDLDRNPTV
jgi:hypothetical protein